MAFHHHHQQQQHRRHHHQEIHQPIITSTTSSSSCCCCCDCQPPPCQHSPSAADPYAVAAIVAQLLQTPNPNQTSFNPVPNHFYPPTLKPTNINVTRNHRYSLPNTDQFHDPHSGVFSLLQRIDALEAALHRFSSSPSSFSLRHAAARTIQTHFRAYLVRRSRALRHLKELASIKSAIVSLKASLSRSGFVDFDFLSSTAMDLLLHVDSIQGDDQMVRDSKRAITREVDLFLDSLDGMYVKRQQVITKTVKATRLSGNDNRVAREHGREFSEHVGRSKCGNMSNDEKKLLGNLKARAERIGRLSRELEDEEGDIEEEMKGYNKHIGGSDEDGNYILGKPSKHGMENGGLVKKNALVDSILREKKRVTFVEDGNAVRVYDVHENENGSRDVNEVEASNVKDKDEAWNHVVQSV